MKIFKKERNMIVGVMHSDDAEINEVLSILKNKSFSTIGLELPQDYLLEESRGATTSFFGKLATILTAQGKKVIPLDDTELLEQGRIVGIAFALANNQADRKIRIEFEISFFKDRIQNCSKDEVYVASRTSDMHNKALELVNKTTNEELCSLFGKSVRDRTAWSLEKVRRDKPQIVVMGNNHAYSLAKQLPNYAYITTSKIPWGNKVKL